MFGLRIGRQLPFARLTCQQSANKAMMPYSVRAFSQLSWGNALAQSLKHDRSFKSLNNSQLNTLTRAFPRNNLKSEQRQIRFNSTNTPPPSPDKDVKGRALLRKITGFTTFSASLLLVVAGVAFCGLVLYLILSELFLPSGDTKTFNKAVSLVEQNEQAQEALGFKKGDRLKAYGEVPGDQWVRNRPVQSVRQKGKDGKDHLAMRFHVESDSGKHGSVFLEQIDTSFWSSEFAYVALELPSKKRIYIVEPKFASKNYVPKSGVFGGSGFLGLSWGPKKD